MSTYNICFNRNKKNNVYPCKPQFYYIKVGFKGVKLYRRVFVMLFLNFCPLRKYLMHVDIIFFIRDRFYSASRYTSCHIRGPDLITRTSTWKPIT